jgi:hypothetical protein
MTCRARRASANPQIIVWFLYKNITFVSSIVVPLKYIRRLYHRRFEELKRVLKQQCMHIASLFGFCTKTELPSGSTLPLDKNMKCLTQWRLKN